MIHALPPLIHMTRYQVYVGADYLCNGPGSVIAIVYVDEKLAVVGGCGDIGDVAEVDGNRERATHCYHGVGCLYLNGCRSGSVKKGIPIIRTGKVQSKHKMNS